MGSPFCFTEKYNYQKKTPPQALSFPVFKIDTESLIKPVTFREFFFLLSHWHFLRIFFYYPFFLLISAIWIPFIAFIHILTMKKTASNITVKNGKQKAEDEAMHRILRPKMAASGKVYAFNQFFNYSSILLQLVFYINLWRQAITVCAFFFLPHHLIFFICILYKLFVLFQNRNIYIYIWLSS